MVFLSYIAQGARAGWFIGDKEETVYPTRPGYTPTLDGVADATWDSAKKFLNTDKSPPIEFRMKYNGSMVYCLIIVKIYTHSVNESVLLILSNNGTALTESNPTLFVDAKYIDIHGRTEDRRWQASDYVLLPGDETNLAGSVNFDFEQGIRNNSVYEFGFPCNNTKLNQNINWTFGNTYAAKIRVQDETEDWSIEYPLFGIEFGLAGGLGNETISPFDVDWNLLTWIAFIIVGGLYGIIGVYVTISRSKVIAVPKERAPEELEEPTEPSTDTPVGEPEEQEDLEEE